MRLVGLPGELTAKTLLGSLPSWDAWLGSIAHGLEHGRPAGAMVAELAEDASVAGSIYSALTLGHMGGQLFVRAVEVPESMPTRALDTRGPDTFFSMPFQEALSAFLSKEIMTPEAFRALSDALRQRAWTATNLASEQLVRRAFDALRRHLAEGGTLQSFVAQVRDGEASLGVEPASPHYLETVYRSSVQTAYGQGRLAQLDHPAVQTARPLVQYRTAGDSRVRSRHRQLDGKTFDRSSDAGWRRFAPPLGYNCRCSLVTVRTATEITDSATLGDLGADDGWTSPGSA